jgi:DNA-binding Xre family transcriptional regulator
MRGDGYSLSTNRKNTVIAGNGNGGFCIMISYKPLWKTLIEKEINKTTLRDMVGFSNGTLARMNKGQYVEMKHIDKICQVLDVSISEVIEILPDTQMTPREKV